MPPLGSKDRHAILVTLGRRIAARRKARWLWQRDIAKTLGLTTD
jgi:hypothetical protein